jgi:hypothetical protein
VDEGRGDNLYAKSKKDRPQDPFDGKIKLSSFIDDPHQKFYYTFNFDRPFDFHVELMKIILDDAPGVTYPSVVRSVGEAPKQFGNVFNPSAAAADTPDEDFDFLHEMAYSPEDAEDFSEVTDTGIDELQMKRKLMTKKVKRMNLDLATMKNLKTKTNPAATIINLDHGLSNHEF